MLKRLIKEKGKTQSEVAIHLGVHQTLISQWCHGKTRPSIFEVSKLATFLGVSIEEIVNCLQETKEI